MSTIIKSKQVGNYTINIEYDECPESPREWDDLSTIYSNHKHYSPDNHDIDEILDEEGYLDMDGKVGLMAWLFEHTQCRFLTSEIGDSNPFGDGLYARFDSGWFGVIAMPIEKAKEEWGEDWEKMAKQYMKGCIEEYDAYANGQVYAYEIIAKNGEIVDSCGGYYDADEAMAEAVGIAECFNAEDKAKIEKTLESASLQELKELFYEFATPAPTWADELFELADESKAKEWLKTKLREIVPTDEWMEIV
jgi:hypothetical protein